MSGTLAIIGGGSWGTALSLVLSPRFEKVRLWVHDPATAAQMAGRRENVSYLPGFALPENVEIVNSLAGALDRAGMVLGAMPSAHARGLYRSLAPLISGDVLVVSATKGLERGSLQRVSSVIREELGPVELAVLAGPGFAREVAAGEPAALVIASEQAETAARVQAAFAGPTFRLYSNTDPIGVEIGGALKNVIAIAAGVCHGLGLGNNTLAALITRGLAEISRLAVALGAQPLTMSGLAGLGDLVLTCNGSLSRNRRLGVELAQGRSLDTILGDSRMVVEGVETTDAAVELAGREGVDVPIIAQMHAVLRKGRSPRDGLRELMDRALKAE